MPIISAHDLKKVFVERLLFDGVSFEIAEKDRVGLVGVNGCGKTTLFRILLGEEGYDSGELYRSKNAKIMSMTQTIADTGKTVYEATLEAFKELIKTEAELDAVAKELETAEGERLDTLIKRQHALREDYEFSGGLTYKSRTRSALMGLGFTEKELDKRLGDMSGGQRNKAQLAKVLLSGAQLLLLDEPTNHLDMDSIAWLEEFLKGYQGAFIVISHDRYFLDAVTRRTMEIKNTRFFMSEGNYTRHRELMADEQEMLRRRYVNTQKEIRRIEGIVEQQRRWGQEHNFVTAASKQKQADRLRATLVKPERDTDSIHFRFHADAVSGNEVVIAKGLAKRFDKSVFKNVDLLIKKGERVFLLGPNGCGKTTLLKILMGRLKPDGGAYSLGANVHAGYYEQNAASLSSNVTAIEEIRNTYPRMSDTQIRSALAAFLFRGDDVFKPLEKLSGGEVARVKLLKLMLTGSNLLLLDEPTNHLDIDSREALEAALEEYEGTMLIVTHDRYLVERLADRVLCMTENGIESYIGGYVDYLKAKQEREADEAKRKSVQRSAAGEDYRARRERQSAINRASGELRRAEDRVSQAEEEISRLEDKLASPQVATNYVEASELSRTIEEKKRQLDGLYSLWEQAQAALERLEKAEQEQTE